LENIERLKIDDKELIKEFLPARFSFTQIKDFLACPRLYYYRYIVKVPMKGNAYFSFGSSIHLTLQKFFEEVKRRQGSAQADLFSHGKAAPAVKKSIPDLVKLEELLKLYEACWIGDWYKDRAQKEEYYKQGLEILKNFYHSSYLTEANPVFLEKPFNFKLVAHTITGKIDRIDEIAGGLKIIDYKTGKAKDKLAAEDKEQLLIYQMAAQFITGGTVKELAYYYLENNSQVPFLGTVAEIAKLQEKIIRTIEEIKDFDFVDYLKKHERCDYCKEII
jgi:DNA helicase-2/ATP-dependent DNA helicase PcrA